MIPQSIAADRQHPAFRDNAAPFYNIVMEGLKGEVDGGHFWDAVAEEAVFEFLYNIPGFTNRINGRKAYMDWFGQYSMQLTHADGLRTYKDRERSVVIFEYTVHGTAPATGKPYHNRFCSVITIKNRSIIHWRDYCDTLSVFRALT